MLFTAFADPPKEWREWAQNSKFENGYKAKTIQALLNPDQAPNTFNPSMTALFVAEFFGIHYRKLPVILFANDLNKKHCYWFETGNEKIMNHFNQLQLVSFHLQNKNMEAALRAAHFPHQEIKTMQLDDEFATTLLDLSQSLLKVQGGINDFSKTSKVETSTWQEPFSSSISKNPEILLKLRNLKPPKTMIISRNIEELIKERIMQEDSYQAFESCSASPVLYSLKKQSDVVNPMSDNQDSNRKKISNFSLTLQKFLNLFQTKKHPQESLQVEIKKLKSTYNKNCNFLEKETQLYFNQAFQLLEYYTEKQIASPYILSFGLAFEKESMHTLAHWVRNNYTINLPEFYFEFQPNKDAKVLMHRQYTIDFNEGRNDQWQPPTLAGILNGFQSSANYLKQNPFGSKARLKTFGDISYKMRRLRNDACHPTPTSLQNLIEMIGCWQSLLHEGYFRDLMEFKKRFRGY